MLFPLELLGVLLAGIAAAVHLSGRREHAGAMLGVGLYLLVVAGAIGTLFPLWLPQDNTILGLAVLSGLLAAVGAALAFTSATILADSPSLSRLHATSAAAGSLAFLVVTAGGLVHPLAQLHAPLLFVAVVGLSAAALVRHQLRSLIRPLLLTLASATVTILMLLVRGPDDWASASGSLKLYSFPILVMALGFSLAMLSERLRTVST